MSFSYKIINKHSGADLLHTNQDIAEFLNKHLQEYGDPVPAIKLAIEYIFKEHRGGHVILALDEQKIIGAVVLNETGMEGYIPENILVYIAVDSNYRGNGLGKQLMQHAIKITRGGIALHVEPNNPAKRLYERLGFENKYLEMRLIKK